MRLVMMAMGGRRRGVLVLGVLAISCAPTLTSQGAAVSVFLVKMDDAKSPGAMPEGCRLLATRPPVSMTEADIAVQKDPYRLGRNEAGAAGGNALLVRSPVTDCPGYSGAWYSLVYESYVCTPDALKQLNTPPSPRPSPSDKAD
jgi:hypothetical protein